MSLRYKAVDDNDTNTFTVDSLGVVKILNTTNSLNSTTGALVVTGGITSKNLRIDDTINCNSISSGNVFFNNISAGTMSISTSTTFVDLVYTNGSGSSLNLSTGLTTGNILASDSITAAFNNHTIGPIITTGGNIGIGLSDPGAGVHALIGDYYNNSLGTWTDNHIVFGRDEGVTSGGIGFAFDFTFGGSFYSIAPSIAWKNMTYNAFSHYFLTNGGYVAIGHTAPAYDLDVSGNIYASEFILAPLSTITNLVSTNASIANLNLGASLTTTNIESTYSTFTNVLATNISTSNLDISSAFGASSISTGTMNAVNSTMINLVVTNASTASVNFSVGLTTGTLLATDSINASFNNNTLGPIITTGGNTGFGTVNPVSKTHTVLTDSFDSTFGAWGNQHAIIGNDQGSTSGAIGFGYHINSGGTLFSVSPSVTWRDMTYHALNHVFLTSGGTFGNVGIGTATPTYNLDVVGNARVSNGIESASSTITNLIATGITTGTLTANTGITTGTLLATTSISTGTLDTTTLNSTNQVATDITTATLHATTGITTGTLLATTSISTGTLDTTTLNSTNQVATNITSATLNASTGITTGTLLATTSISTGTLDTTTLNSTNQVATNITSATLTTSTGITTGTLTASTGITTGTLLATTSISTGTLDTTTLNSTNQVATNITSSTLTTSTGITTGTLTASTGITTGTLLATTSISTGTLDTTTLNSTNQVVTNITSSTLNASTGITTGTLTASTGITTGTLLATTSISTGTLDTTTLNSTNQVVTNITSSTLNASTGITTGTLLVTTSISTGTLDTTTLNSTNQVATNITTSTLTTSTGITTGTLLATTSISTGILETTDITSSTLVVDDSITSAFNNHTIGPIITTGGNVGIGLSDPGAGVHALIGDYYNNSLGTWTDNHIVFGRDEGITSGGLGFAFDFTFGGSFYSIAPGINWKNMTYNAANHYFLMSGSSVGNVAIGHTAPAYNLDVLGSINASNFILAPLSTITNLVSTNASIANLNLGASLTTTNIESTNSTFTNTLATDITTATLHATTGITTGTLLATTSISTGTLDTTTLNASNQVASNITSATLTASTGITTGTLLATTSISTGTLDTTTLNSTNQVASNITSATLTASTGITTGTLLATTSISTGTLDTTTLNSTNQVASNITSATLTASTGITTGTLLATTSISTGTLDTTTLNSTNQVATNITTATLTASTGITTGTLLATTSISTGILETTDITTTTLVTTDSITAAFNNHTIGPIVTTGGNIGIDTVSPVAKVHTVLNDSFDSTFGVWGNQHAIFGNDQGGTTGAIGLGFHINSGGTLFSVSPSVAWRDMTYHALNHVFLTSGGTFGNVGIGTATPTYNLDVVGNARVSNGIESASSTITNLISTNASISNLDLGASLTTTNIESTNSTLTNVLATDITTATLHATTGITTGTLLATTSISTGTLDTTTLNSTNQVATNITSATLQATTGITTGTLLATTSISTGTLDTTTLNSTNQVASNITSATLTASTGITTGTLLATTSISTGILETTDITSSTLVVGDSITSAFNNHTIGPIITTGGNVGIGLSEPGAGIHALIGDYYNNNLGTWTDNHIVFGRDEGNTSGGLGFAFDFTFGGSFYSIAPGINWKNMTYNAANHYFLMSGSSVGKVSIGHTAPAYNLDVLGSINASEFVLTPLSTITNLVSTNITTATLTTTNIESTNSTFTNTLATDITTATLHATTGITTGTLLATTSISTGTLDTTTLNSTNQVATNITSATLTTSTGITTGTLTASTGITTGTLLATTSISTGTLDTTTLNSTNQVATNITSATLTTSTGITTGTLTASTGITTGTLLATTSISTGTLDTTTLNSTNQVATNISSTSLVLSTGLTTGSINSGILNTIGPVYTKTNNVSVNTTSGTALLQVNLTESTNVFNSSAWDSSHAVFGADDNVGAGMGLHYNSVSGGVLAVVEPGVSWRHMSYMAGTHNFYSFGSTTSSFYVSGAGTPLVGINTTAPGYTFDVDGEINSSSVISCNTFAGINSTITNLVTSNFTSENIVVTGLSSGSVNGTNATFTNIVMSTSTIENVRMTNLSTGTLNVTDATIANLNLGSGVTTGTAFITTNLGIGTTSPSYTLDVIGTGHFDSTTESVGPGTGALVIDGGMSVAKTIRGAGNVFSQSNNANGTANLLCYNDLNNYVQISAFGSNIGNRADITTILDSLTLNTNATGKNLIFQTNNATRLLVSDTQANFTTDVQIDQALISTFNSNTIGPIITTGGNTGFGTVSPVAKIHTVLTDSFSSGFGTWGAEHAIFGNDLGGTTGAVGVGYHVNSGGTLFALSPSVAWRDMTYHALNHVFLTSGGTFGNVGIGTATPAYNLDVVGTGNFSGALSKGGGSFDIEHPLKGDPDERLIHSFIEGPRCDLIYRGTTSLSSGSITVDLDTECVANLESAMTQGTFEALISNPVCYLQNNDSFDRVKGSISAGTLTITCENASSDDNINWLVIGERKDAFVQDWNRTNTSGHLVTEYLKA